MQLLVFLALLQQSGQIHHPRLQLFLMYIAAYLMYIAAYIQRVGYTPPIAIYTLMTAPERFAAVT